ncbi:MAG: hypothetical protein IGBAC_2089 [Ignavibacteriae bacterium]|nr:MAG: hypothetical protein IGBAC_2089 [Ignavibacteriota bacterium]
MFFALSVFFFTSLYSQNNTAWIRTLDGPFNYWDESKVIAVDDSGNVYSSGFTIVGGNYICDFMTAKYDNFGNLKWVKTLDWFSYDVGENMLLGKDGNIIISGTDEGVFTLLKYSPGGDLLWKTYSPGHIRNSIVLDDSGNIYLAGQQDYKSVLVKFNSDGVKQWERIYSGPAENFARTSSLTRDKAGFIYIAGCTNTFTGNSILLMKYNPSGDTIWTKIWGDSLDGNEISAITADNFCNIYIAGYTSKNFQPINPIVLKYDSSGTLLWSISNNPAGSRSGQWKKISLDKNNNVYLAGDAEIPGHRWDFIISKFNTDGDSIWTTTFNGTANNNDYLYDMIMDNSTNIYCTGGAFDLFGGWNCVTIMYDSSCQQRAIQRFNGNGNSEDEGFSIALDKWNNVFVGGRTLDSVNSFDYLLIKYGENLTEIKESKTNQPNKLSLYQNYPNPFNPSTTIKFKIPKTTHVTLKIYNILGQEVAELVNEEIKPGVYNINWNASNIASGVYFYRLKVGDFIKTNKMIITK